MNGCLIYLNLLLECIGMLWISQKAMVRRMDEYIAHCLNGIRWYPG